MSQVIKVEEKYESQANYFPGYPKSILRMKLTSGEPITGKFPDDVEIELSNAKSQSDLYEIGGVFFCSGKMKTVLEEVDSSSQFFPVKTHLADGLYPTGTWSTDFYLFNISHCVDAVDPKRGKYKRRRGEIVEIRSLSLNEEKLAGVHVSRLPQDHFVVVMSGELVSALQTHDIEGIEYIEPSDFSNEF